MTARQHTRPRGHGLLSLRARANVINPSEPLSLQLCDENHSSYTDFARPWAGRDARPCEASAWREAESTALRRRNWRCHYRYQPARKKGRGEGTRWSLPRRGHSVTGESGSCSQKDKRCKQQESHAPGDLRDEASTRAQAERARGDSGRRPGRMGDPRPEGGGT